MSPPDWDAPDYRNWCVDRSRFVLADHFRNDRELLSLEYIKEPGVLNNVEYNLELQEFTRALSRAVQCLSKRDLVILQLRYFERCSIQEISQKMSLTKNNVSQILHRAILKLRLQMVD